MANDSTTSAQGGSRSSDVTTPTDVRPAKSLKRTANEDEPEAAVNPQSTVSIDSPNLKKANRGPGSPGSARAASANTDSCFDFTDRPVHPATPSEQSAPCRFDHQETPLTLSPLVVEDGGDRPSTGPISNPTCLQRAAQPDSTNSPGQSVPTYPTTTTTTHPSDAFVRPGGLGESSDDDSDASSDASSIESSIIDVISSMPVSPRPSGPPTLVAADILTDEEKCFVRSEAKELGLADFMRKYCLEEEVPVRALIAAFSTRLAAELPADRSDSELLPLLSLTVAKYIRHRDRLEYVRTVDDVVDLVRRARKIMVLTGAGVSVSCGIPDFRSPSGIYARLGEFGLDDPQQMFDIEFFTEAPHIFYSFAKELYPSNFVPSPSHHFIRLLESQGQLLRNYTQNIDTLEHQTGIQRVLNCHGSFATASCIRCGHQVPGEAIREDIFAQTVPHCETCARADLLKKMQRPQQKKNRTHRGNANDDDDDDDTSEGERLPGIMKPDITFFGENLPDVFDRSFAEDHTQVDLLLVIGSSLKVAPVSEVMAHLPANVPQILINKTPNLHMNFDVQLLGDCDDVLAYLCHRLEWDLVHPQLAGGHTLAPEFAELAPTLYRPTEAKAVGPVTSANDNLIDRSTVPTALHAVLDAEQAPSPPPPPPPITVALPHHWHAFRGATVSPRDLEQAQARYPAQWFD